LKVLYATVSVVIADQLTKLFVRGIQIPFLGIDVPGMTLYSSREILGRILRITYVRNPGTAFGLGESFTELFAIFSLIASIAIFAYLYKVRGQGMGIRLSFGLILGGAVGNMLDRVFFGPIFEGTPLFQGRVVDFIDVSLFHLPFVFNIADAAITIGVVMLIFFQTNMSGRREEVEIAGGGGIGNERENGEEAKTGSRPNGAD
jgi:signal peptidase II